MKCDICRDREAEVHNPEANFSICDKCRMIIALVAAEDILVYLNNESRIKVEEVKLTWRKLPKKEELP